MQVIRVRHNITRQCGYVLSRLLDHGAEFVKVLWDIEYVSFEESKNITILHELKEDTFRDGWSNK